MAEKTPQEYIQELMQLYNSVRVDSPVYETTGVEKSDAKEPLPDQTGGLAVNVTTLRQLYPVTGAFVTVFTGDVKNKTVIETAFTDQSGQTGVFKLKTPAKSFSASPNPAQRPYSTYNVMVEADGYVERVFMDVPVFSGIVSVQSADLTPISAAGNRTQPNVTSGENNYNL